MDEFVIFKTSISFNLKTSISYFARNVERDKDLIQDDVQVIVLEGNRTRQNLVEFKIAMRGQVNDIDCQHHV